MKELITIKEQDGQQLVDARELWRGLVSKRDFSNWAKIKVINNPFFEKDVDWSEVLVAKFVEQTGRGGNKRTNYSLTLDTAKK